jgi:hypothetical protein
LLQLLTQFIGCFGKKNLLLKIEKINFQLIGTYSTLNWINIVFCFSLGFASLGQMSDKAFEINFFGASFN